MPNYNPKDVLERFEEEFGGQSELSQAILSALEHRGFYDCGKYLDDDIAIKINPIIKQFILTSHLTLIDSLVEREIYETESMPFTKKDDNPIFEAEHVAYLRSKLDSIAHLTLLREQIKSNME